jgi:ElaB/YqjD/DUF883 family membrane-anchored ribosome-binding protein
MDHKDAKLIEAQMKETRTALTEKAELLEKKVLGTVEGVADTVKTVQEAVQDTVEAVKDTVQGTVDTVKETVQETVTTVQEAFNLPKQIRNHPTLFVGGAFGVGFLAGLFLMPRPRRRTDGGVAPRRPEAGSTYEALRSEPPSQPPEPKRPGVLEMFGDELNAVKELAVGSLMGTLRDLVVKALPEKLSEKAAEVANSLTTKLGGKVI